MIGTSWEIGYNNERKVQIGNVTFTDRSGMIMQQLNNNLDRAANAVGVAAVGMIRKQMISGYQDVHPVQKFTKSGTPRKLHKGSYPHTAIRMSSALINEVHFDVSHSEEGAVVTVGNTLDYALFVHDGTRYLKKRPYIYDAISKGVDRLKAIFETYIAQGFDGTING